MDIQTILDYFSEYGYWLLFFIVYLEYLNLPGLPSGIIMPAAGILISQSSMTFTTAIIVSVLAGLLGSYTLYAIGVFVGQPAIDWLTTKFESTKDPIDKTVASIDKHGNKAILIARVLPVIRTIVSLPAGLFKMKLIPFTGYSLIGIFIWNFVYIFAGYAFADFFLTKF